MGSQGLSFKHKRFSLCALSYFFPTCHSCEISIIHEAYIALVILLWFSIQLDEMLEKRGVKVDKVLNFAIDDAILEERITGRWIHPASGRSYHSKYAPPKVPGVDDVRNNRR